MKLKNKTGLQSEKSQGNQFWIENQALKIFTKSLLTKSYSRNQRICYSSPTQHGLRLQHEIANWPNLIHKSVSYQIRKAFENLATLLIEFVDS